jgi:hypothetical protein
VAVLLGVGIPGDVADGSSGAEEEPRTQERRPSIGGGPRRGESNTLKRIERHERMAPSNRVEEAGGAGEKLQSACAGDGVECKAGAVNQMSRYLGAMQRL